MKRTKLPLCACGCGEQVKTLGRRFIAGHNLKLPLDEQTESKRRQKIKKTMTHILSQPEVREKMFQNAWKGRPHSKETKHKLSVLRTGSGNGMFGKKLTEEARQKLSESRKGRKHSEETKRKIGIANKKNKPTEQQKKQISNTLKAHYQHHENPFKGKKHSEKSLKKMSKALKGKYRGEKASNWQGGIDSLPYGIEWTPWLIDEIRKRDNYTCQNPKCKKPHKLLDVHHIDYDKQNNRYSNLITLCKRCHGKTQKNRGFWINYYQIIISRKDFKNGD